MKAAMQGHHPLASPLDAHPRMALLTPRERDLVLVMSEEGLSTTKELAARMGISSRTVKMHFEQIYHRWHIEPANKRVCVAVLLASMAASS